MILFRSIAVYILLSTMPYGAELVVGPYLQNATPSSMTILWETDSDSPSRLEWGQDSYLDQIAFGSSFTNYGPSQIHTVELTGLSPGTRYYYRVVVGDFESYSELHDFITPPSPSSEQSFRIIAMSDMQQDGSNPDKFDEIVHDGVIDYISDEYSDDIAQELAMVLVPGDLVVTGGSYYQWQDTFFEPSQDLFSHVPFYPVYGNHENDTEFFTNYFHLPNNGTEGYEEHWYYTDYSNLRVIGLDSNSGYRIQTQLDWLDGVLQDACYNSEIDFVFAQLHHPHKSELWVPGEIDYTGDVISLMEEFTEQCGKPSIHFFGHTHGYSRGQSQDHRHLWVNVATAGGNIDYWGEFQQADYDEFTVTQDEWGFVVVDLEAGQEPQFVLTRISRGNENQARDNEVRDQVTIRTDNISPDTPDPTEPGTAQSPDLAFLSASAFDDPDGDGPGASHWLIYEGCDIDSSPAQDIFVNAENWYFNQDTQESVEISSIALSGLTPDSIYCFRVRYRDTGLVWSEWSEPMPFMTSDSQATNNLLTNPGAESGTLGWTVTDGYFEALEALECDGVDPYSGSYYFAVGALCSTSDYAEAYQDISLLPYQSCIEQGGGHLYFGGYLSNWGGSDYPEAVVAFLDSDGNEIARTNTIGTYNSSWTSLTGSSIVPESAVSARMILMGTRYAGNDNDSYFDSLFMTLFESSACLLQGDFNGDSIQNILDIIILIDIVLSGEPSEGADINGDGQIDIIDLIQLVNIILALGS